MPKSTNQLVLDVYAAMRLFPKEELFGLTSQLRRAAISTASNIVDGCARNTEADFLHFLEIAYGSACEVEYQRTIAVRLGYLTAESQAPLTSQSVETCKVLNGLIRSLRKP